MKIQMAIAAATGAPASGCHATSLEAVSRRAAAASEAGEFVGESPTRRIGRFTTERSGACPAARRGGESSPDTEPMGLNEDEPQRMSLDMIKLRSRRVPGAWTKANVCKLDNRQRLQSPAGLAWQARREDEPDKLGDLSR